MFIITSQWNGKKFDEITCNLDPEKDQNYGAYVTGNEYITNVITLYILIIFLIRKSANLRYFTFDMM